MKQVKSKDGVRLRGQFIVECFDRHGNFKWRDEAHNIITTEGLNRLQDVMLHATTQIATWYCCLVETNTTPAAAMTYAVPSYTESTAYTEATRPEYVEAASAAGVTTNTASKAVFTINATKTMYGASLVGGGTAASTKGNTLGGGALYCYALFTASRAVVSDDIINLTYQTSSADDGV